MTYMQLQELSSAILDREQLTFVKLQTLKAQIRATADVNPVTLIIG